MTEFAEIEDGLEDLVKELYSLSVDRTDDERRKDIVLKDFSHQIIRMFSDIYREEAIISSDFSRNEIVGKFVDFYDRFQYATLLIQAQALLTLNAGFIAATLFESNKLVSKIASVNISKVKDSFQFLKYQANVYCIPSSELAKINYGLGWTYRLMGRWTEAIAVLNEAREEFSKQKMRRDLAVTLFEMGQVYHKLQDFEAAYIHFKDALRLFKKLDHQEGVAASKEALGNLTLQTAQPEMALSYLTESREAFASLKQEKRVEAVDYLIGLAREAEQAYS